MTPVGTRDALYCARKARIQGHGKGFVKDAAIIALLHAETDGRTFTKMQLFRATPDAKAFGAAEERWRRVNKRYTLGGISDQEFEAEAARWSEAQAAGQSSEVDGWSVEKEGKPFVDWDVDTAEVNARLRKLFSRVALDPATMEPVAAEWRNPKFARRDPHPARPYDSQDKWDDIEWRSTSKV